MRNSKCILYFFYKNFVFTLVQFIYGFYTNFSGQTIVDDWYITFYNLVFTALPLGARALLDYDLKADDGVIVKKMIPFLYGEFKKFPIFNKRIFFLYLIKGASHCLVNFFITIYSTTSNPIDPDGNTDNLWFTSVNIYTNILVVVSLDLIIDTSNITWINAVIELGTTFLLYIFFLIAVHNIKMFKSFASIYNSVNSSLFWMNMLFVAVFCFIFDLNLKSFRYCFSPTLSRQLQLVYNQYGPINSNQYLSDEIIEKLKVYDENIKEEHSKKDDNKNMKNDQESNEIKTIQIEYLEEKL